MKITKIKCPGGCVKKDEFGMKISDGYLVQVTDEGKKLFCDTAGCNFYYLDENAHEIWKNGEIPISVLKGDIHAKY